MKKFLMISASLLVVIGLSACSMSPSKDDSKEKNDEKVELKKEKVYSDIKVTPLAMNIVKDDSYGQGNEKLFKIKVKMENQSKESIGAGAAPFYMKSDDGKNISYVGERNKFGQELKPKQSVEGDIYYVLDSKKKYTFVYNPSAIGISTKSMKKDFDANDRKLTWKIGIPKDNQ